MSRKLILLIDYEAQIRTILQVCLKHFGGWDVVAAAYFQQGIDALAEDEPDAILLDLPRLEPESVMLTHQLSQNPFSAAVPILLITEKASWFSRHQLQNLGIAGAIAKPFNPITLPEQIATLLGWTVEAQPVQHLQKQ